MFTAANVSKKKYFPQKKWIRLFPREYPLYHIIPYYPLVNIQKAMVNGPLIDGLLCVTYEK